jgi:hypothetical protein
MAIRKKVKHRKHGATDDAVSEVTIPSFSYSNDGLAQLIINAWADPNGFKKNLLDRHTNTGYPTALAYKTATDAVNSLANMSLKRAVVISEQEHDDHYTMQHDEEVVFVLPNADRQPAAGPAPSQPELLETAKLLMACTPNGI